MARHLEVDSLLGSQYSLNGGPPLRVISIKDDFDRTVRLASTNDRVVLAIPMPLLIECISVGLLVEV